MIATSVRRPFADAVFDIGQPVITQDFTTNHRGTLAIRSSNTKSDMTWHSEQIRKRRNEACVWPIQPRAHILGLVDLVDVHHYLDCELNNGCGVADDGFAWIRHSGTQEAVYHWVLRNPRPLPDPIEAPGSRAQGHHAGVYLVPTEIASQIMTALLTLERR